NRWVGPFYTPIFTPRWVPFSCRSPQEDEITQGDLFTQQANVVRESQTSSITTVVMTDELKNWIASQLKSNPDRPSIVEAALRVGVPGADSQLLFQLRRHHEPAPEWLTLVPLLESHERQEYLLERLDRGEGRSEIAVIRLLANEDNPEVGNRLLARLKSQSTPDPLKIEIRHALWRHREWATSLLQAVDRGEIDPASIPTAELRHVAVHEDAVLNALVRKYWGNVGAGTPEEKLAVMRRFSNDLRAGTGDLERGRSLFVKHCGTCHKMKGEGGGIAPDLTTANRHDRAALLANIVDPSAVIRREFLRYVVETDNGQIVAGLLADQDPASVTLVDERNQRNRISRDQIASMTESNTSLMPERILENLTPQERRDLFAYLEQP
ncbi:c-type cytochrome, partial [bacterium]|nr:c-type cytochrome [bacterium]